MDFYRELHAFGAVPVRAGFIVFSGLPLALLFLRGHPLVELTEYNDSAANIIVHSI